MLIKKKDFFRFFIVFFCFLSVVFFQISSGLAETEPLTKKIAKAIPNFALVEEDFYRGAQPTEEAYNLLKELGIKTVISFLKESEVNLKEAKELEKVGINFMAIPWLGLSKPKDKDIDAFLNKVSQIENRPVFVHCQRGQERTGVMVACYRIAHNRWSAERAYEEMLKYGFRPFWFGHLKQYVFKFAASHGMMPEKKIGFFESIKYSLLYFIYNLRKINPFYWLCINYA